MGADLNQSKLREMSIGDYAQVPKRAAHFGRARTAVTIQVHGIGPFSTDSVAPILVMTADGVFQSSSAGRLENPINDVGPSCFPFPLGASVTSPIGAGITVGAQCSSSNGFTQYWIETATGERIWSPVTDLSRR